MQDKNKQDLILKSKGTICTGACLTQRKKVSIHDAS
jgi:hypothetical protein